MPVQYGASSRSTPRYVGGGPVRPLAHGRAVGRRVGRGRRPGPRARHRSAHLAVGRAQYSMICAPDGGIIDDLIVYRVAGSGSWWCPTRRTRPSCRRPSRERLAGFDARLDDASDRTALVAVQGPSARGCWRPSRTWRSTTCATTPSGRVTVAGVAAWVARTGYTGEDGFEVFLAGDDAGPSGRRCWRGPPMVTSCPAAWAPETPCAWRRACPSTATSSTATAKPFEAGLGRSSSSTSRAASSVARRWPRPPQRARASCSSGLGLREPGIARHGYPVYPGRRRARGRRHQRQPVADPGHGHRDGMVPPAPAAGYHGRGRRPRARGSRRRSSRCRSIAAGMSCAGDRRLQGIRARPAPQPTQGEIDRWTSRQACGTAMTTSGCVPTGATAPWASPATPLTSSATSSSWSCPRSGADAHPRRDLRGHRVGQDGERPVLARSRARWSRSTWRSAARRNSSTAIPTVTAGSIRLRLVDPSEADLLKDADAYRALIGA